MARVKVDCLTREIRELLVDWLMAEGLSPASIVDDGRFSIHNGRVSGNQFVFAFADDNPEHKLIWRKDAVATHFNVPQINPLPEILKEALR